MNEEQKLPSPVPVEDAPRVLQRKREKEPKLKPGKKRMPADFNRKMVGRRFVRSPK